LTCASGCWPKPRSRIRANARRREGAAADRRGRRGGPGGAVRRVGASSESFALRFTRRWGYAFPIYWATRVHLAVGQFPSVMGKPRRTWFFVEGGWRRTGGEGGGDVFAAAGGLFDGWYPGESGGRGGCGDRVEESDDRAACRASRTGNAIAIAAGLSRLPTRRRNVSPLARDRVADGVAVVVRKRSGDERDQRIGLVPAERRRRLRDRGHSYGIGDLHGWE